MSVSVLGVLEFSSIASGIDALDKMVKAALVSILDVKIVNPGKYLILITGSEASVDVALFAGKTAARNYLVNELFIPNLHAQVIPAIRGVTECLEWDAVGIVEAQSSIACIEGGDLAVKTADVQLLEIRLENNMGGKSTLKIVGSIGEVEIAVEAAASLIESKGFLESKIIIPRLHADIRPFFL